jgi:hypothetical protein
MAYDPNDHYGLKHNNSKHILVPHTGTLPIVAAAINTARQAGYTVSELCTTWYNGDHGGVEFVSPENGQWRVQVIGDKVKHYPRWFADHTGCYLT